MRISATTGPILQAHQHVENSTSNPASPGTGSGKGALAPQFSQFASPVTAFDAVTGSTVLEYRNTKTGAEDYQSPARAVLLYQHSLTAAAQKQKDTTHA